MNLTNPELVAISMCVGQRLLDPMLAAGLRPDHMGLPVVREALAWLIDYSRQHRALPTQTEFHRKFPALDPVPVPSRVTPESISNEIIALSLHREAMTRLEMLRTQTQLTSADVQSTVSQLRTLLSEHQTGGPVTAAEAMDMALRWYEQGKDRSVTGLPYPWDCLNIETRGIHPGEFLLWYGRPKVGKTFILLYILACMHAQVEGRVLFVSFEMDLQRLVNRLACIRALLPYAAFRKCLLDEKQLRALHESIIYFEESKTKRESEIVFDGPAINPHRRKKGYTILDIEQRARDVEAKAVFIDGLLHAGDIRTGKRARDWSVVGNISSDTKQMALLLNIPVLATHQANREGEKDVPINSQVDIAYADALGQDADATYRITRLRSSDKYGRRLLIQPTGAREFELLGFLVNGECCNGFDGVAVPVTSEKELRKHLKKEDVADPSAMEEYFSLSQVAQAGDKAKKP